MIEFALATALSTVVANSQPDSEKVNRFCAYLVGIPYASDNFTDAEYERFLVCKEIFE
jgi:hypothetical protein